ncbi:hypothetical protein ACYFX5_18055 [Bremerella sp. T1]|uniref:hypothetical protein n=1 Tax=Bremerella sp. TYQ1 TaxID=3119568 RepID=UPI001CC96541|nr:hypothetical protein [Bremerella volcania]UBM34961.1 hypothetical protein LA756_20010 [Bremerella volcania]
MTGEPSGIEYQRIRAPRGDGEVLVDPSPLHPSQLIAENQSRFQNAAQATLSYDQTPLESLRQTARREIVQLAIEHSSRYRNVPQLPDVDRPVVLTGHQPALYHPGVWFKNFLVDQLAASVGGTAINVIVDNDVAPAPSISALTGSPSEPKPARIAYDMPGPRVAWEMTYASSLETLRTFAQRTEETIGPLVANPLVSTFWPDVVEAVESGLPLGLAFSAARSRLEESFGLRTLDVPLSRLCQTEWFCQVAGYVFANAMSYRYAYNRCVQQYRDVHKIRSTSHPVPDLGAEDGFVEVPFWIWTQENASRRGLWVSVSLKRIILTDKAGWQIELPHDERLPESLQSLTEQGVFIRPRALMTTTILRLVASDLFVHGIGGAKYDQVTDEICRYFFGVQPPEFVTATATAQLPVKRSAVDRVDLRQVERHLRDAEFNPDRAVDDGDVRNDAAWQSLLDEKSRLLADVPNFPEKRTWHRQLEEVNAKLRKQIAEPVARLRIERDQIVQTLHEKQLLASREYSFVLFPKEGLRNLLLDLAQKEI